MALYLIANGPSPTTAAQVPVTTGNVIKTMLQVKPGTTRLARIAEWGFSLNGFAAALPIKVELIETDVAATVTAHVAAGIVKYDLAALLGGDPTTAQIAVGTTSTGYTASGEGSITTSRVLEPAFFAPSAQYYKQYPLGREPIIQASLFGRIRVTAAAAVDMYCYMIVDV